MWGPFSIFPSILTAVKLIDQNPFRFEQSPVCSQYMCKFQPTNDSFPNTDRIVTSFQNAQRTDLPSGEYNHSTHFSNFKISAAMIILSFAGYSLKRETNSSGFLILVAYSKKVKSLELQKYEGFLMNLPNRFLVNFDIGLYS